MSPSAFESATTRLKDFARHAVGEGAPAVVLNVRDNAQETAEALGVRDRTSGAAAEATDKLWISGLGTSMVAVSVMKLVEQDRIALDDQIAEAVPEFATIFPS